MWEIAVHLAVAVGVYDGVFFVLSLFQRDVLDKILDLIESVCEGFPTYSYQCLLCLPKKAYFSSIAKWSSSLKSVFSPRENTSKN